MAPRAAGAFWCITFINSRGTSPCTIRDATMRSDASSLFVAAQEARRPTLDSMNMGFLRPEGSSRCFRALLFEPRPDDCARFPSDDWISAGENEFLARTIRGSASPDVCQIRDNGRRPSLLAARFGFSRSSRSTAARGARDPRLGDSVTRAEVSSGLLVAIEGFVLI